MSDFDSNVDADGSLSLNTIPTEIFLHICSFLEGKEIIESLKYVCQSFYEILSDDSVWRFWLKQRWPKLPPSNICYKDDSIQSVDVCMQIDRGLKLWSGNQNKFKKWIDDSVHISTVDTVKLIQGGTIGISGCRDRSLGVWSTDGKLDLLHKKSNAHEGWIWALDFYPENKHLYSCSWDNKVKEWNLDGQLVETASFKCSGAVLSIVYRPELIVAGLFSPRVEMFDPRNSSSAPIGSYSSHKRSVLALCYVKDMIVSASEDRTISVWDIKASKIFKSGILVSADGTGHPMTLSFGEGNLLFVGDTKNKLHIFDTNSFQLLESFDMGHSPNSSITTMWHNSGFILTGSKDNTVRVHTTTRPPHLINSLSSSNGAVTSLDFVDPALFVGCGNSAVELWMPC